MSKHVNFVEGTSSGITAHKMVRQSFGRFYDKIVENILLYLTFNEKVLFESILNNGNEIFIINRRNYI